MKLEFHRKFQIDFEDATQYYLQKGGTELAQSFINEVVGMFDKIRENPFLNSIVYDQVRRARLKRFKYYAIRYVVVEEEDTVFFISLLSAVRHPDVGKDRF